MKSIVSASLLVVFSMQFIYSIALNTWFYTNQAVIAKTLCINKDKPASKCKGHCFLSKKMKAAEDKQEQESPKQQKQQQENSPYHISNFQYQLNIFWPGKNYTTEKTSPYHFLPVAEIFHPPLHHC
ncbi:MAG: hypothetical protein WAT19_01795 [Ferruginibacter sp.]